MLANQIQNIIQAGHLQPGYHTTGLFDSRAKACSDSAPDYWHTPADTLYTLLLALPHLPADLQASTRTYLQNEFAAYPPYRYDAIGWKDGVQREAFNRPPEFESDRVNYPPLTTSYNNFDVWGYSPHSFYAMWKYAQQFGGAKSIFDSASSRLPAVPPDSTLLAMPHVVNAYITGYQGYLNLQVLAGYAESASVRSELNRLLNFRTTNFSAGSTYEAKSYCRALIASQNFMYLVPELATRLRTNGLTKVQSALNQYYQTAPYWFVPNIDVTFGEGSTQNFYDSHSIFLAKALILQQSRQELTRYLDVPAVQRGDLFFIQKLIYAIEAP
jgi:hypothetical protein